MSSMMLYGYLRQFKMEHVQECKKCPGALACLSDNWHLSDSIQCTECKRVFVSRAVEIRYRPSMFIVLPPCTLTAYTNYVCRTCSLKKD